MRNPEDLKSNQEKENKTKQYLLTIATKPAPYKNSSKHYRKKSDTVESKRLKKQIRKKKANKKNIHRKSRTNEHNLKTHTK